MDQLQRSRANHSSKDFLSWDSDIDLDSLLGDYTADENDKCSSASKQSLTYVCPECKKEYKSMYGFRGHAMKKHELSLKDSIAFDKGDIEEEKGLYDIAEEDCLDEELLQEENSERNFLSNGGSVDCSRKSPQPGLNLSDQHSETNFRGVKRPSNRQHRHGRSVKRMNSPYHELNLNDIDSDDSQGDPTYMDKDSSSNDEESPPQISTKHYKQRWSPEELQTFNQIFSACLRQKLMPTAAALKMAAAELPKRTILK